jgi:adenylate cyclase
MRVCAIIIVVTQLSVAMGVIIFDRYLDLSRQEFWTVMIICQGLLLVDNLLRYMDLSRQLRPVIDILAFRAGSSVPEAWDALVALPLTHARRWMRISLLITALPASILITIFLGLNTTDLFFVICGSSVIFLYTAALRYLGLDVAFSPLPRRLAAGLPEGYLPKESGPSAKTKLFIALPALNVVSGVVVAALLSPENASLADFGMSVLVSVLVTSTISALLIILIAETVLAPSRRLKETSQRLARGDLSSALTPASPEEAGAMGESLNKIATSLAQGDRAANALDAFVDPTITDQLLDKQIVREARMQELTVMFCDLRGFSARAARQSAHQTVEDLNRFYEIVVPIVENYQGNANKFIGDGMLSIFGAPEDDPEDALHAVLAGEEIARACLDAGISVGIGLHRGEALIGTVGGGGRLDFTVIGETVNTASRIEALTRETGDDLLLSSSVAAPLRRELFSRGYFDIDSAQESLELFSLTKQDDALTVVRREVTDRVIGAGKRLRQLAP